jgi:predicted dehydrogenase
MRPLRIGLIGAGRIAQLVHLAALTRSPWIRLAAIAEQDDARRAEAARRAPGAQLFAGAEQLLASPEIEAVVICLPTALHAATAIAALHAGKHVYLEKPLAASLDEGRLLAEAWRRADRVGMIGFNYRFNALYQAARRQLDAGAIGELLGAQTVFTSAARTLPGWKLQRRSGGGALLDLGTHHLDMAAFLLRRPVRAVAARIESRQSEADTAWVELQLDGGPAVQSFFATGATDEDRFTIFGSAGTLSVDRQRGWNVELTPAGPRPGHLAAAKARLRTLAASPYLRQRLLAPGSEPSFEAALNRFAAAVHNRQLDYPSFAHGLDALALVEAAEEAAAGGRAVPVGGAEPATLPAGDGR